jgi:type I restriction enzyme S subunit
MDGSYHNADINIYDNILQSHSTHCLDFYCSNIYTTGRGRRVYTRPERGVPFLSNSDMMAQNPLMSCNFMSRKYGYDESSVLKGGMILTGRVGAIGQTAFVPKYWERYKMMGSDNIIRIVVKEEFKNGLIYAYLASKYGNLSFWKHATGGVQPFITDKMVADLPIPNFPESFQQEVDDLIQESTRLREEAADALQQAIQQVEDIIPYPSKKNVGCVSSRTILSSHNRRFEANYYISEGHDIEKYIYKNFKWKPLGQVCEDISRPDIFKRFYVQNGIVFLGGADIFLASPDSKKQLSKTKTTNISSLAIKENTILIPRSGTIGNVAWAHAGHAQKLASEHVIRLQPNDILRGGYIYAFLSSSIGKALIQKHIFGSVIQHIEPPHLKLIPIPVIEDSIIDNIHKLVIEYSKKVGKAIENERQAISMIEQEIESWTK